MWSCWPCPLGNRGPSGLPQLPSKSWAETTATLHPNTHLGFSLGWLPQPQLHGE